MIRGKAMVSKCANPACSTSFLYLHEGKLFRVEVDSASKRVDAAAFGIDSDLKKPVRHIEFYWLCSGCSQKMTVSFEKGVGIKTLPLERARAMTSRGFV